MEEKEIQTFSKREQKKQLNRQNIINAAIQLFSSKPFSEVSMRAIAKDANVSPGLIYQYFDDQQHLFMTAFKIESTNLLNALRQTIEIQDDQLAVIARKYIDYMFRHDNLYQMMTYFMLENDHHGSVSAGLRDITDDLFAIFREALSKHLPEKQLKSAAQLFFASLNGILITYKNLPGRSQEATWQHIEHLVEVLVATIKRAYPE
ncbi:TetR/AcrR family transcriptional regulator [Lysinibacillus parviboronicapiens]|uniref:TetR/AcrR family transcriptional regulator n=1 Tax=Lysinibacillus parviboronicapiens TaxID=436516 RepID=UPI000D35A6A8|nr:TetR/AcrR family transcriptional regulator [Lysinibacillus parviboronicapiens]